MQHDCTACYAGTGCSQEPVGHLGGVAIYADPRMPEGYAHDGCLSGLRSGHTDLRDGDYVVVRPKLQRRNGSTWIYTSFEGNGPGVETLAQFRSDRCGSEVFDEDACPSGCCQRFSYIGTDLFSRVDEVEVVRRVVPIDSQDLALLITVLEVAIRNSPTLEQLRDWTDLRGRIYTNPRHV